MTMTETQKENLFKRAVSALENIANSLASASDIPKNSSQETLTNDPGTLQNVRDVLFDFGLSQDLVAGIINNLEDFGIVFLEVEKTK